ncbi:hypothetical protein [Silvanigrella aquatica]|uniref:LapB rubredoxin metal binding domain-containing protein n=1 Tax=Silvanigrella aquatica TaxID=1915309 RepID=A0A1L4D2Q3_9BACT|nr:hypothetical protein [Silvanigrella aquatica]APJ04472.1 hypothetical protein AXG55_11355 [Silvanigrella aquatica]
MTRQMTTLSAEGMPMWDTFEASFFVGAGLSVGIVLGILFPSLWRTFRRRFRKSAHYAPEGKKLESKISVHLKILGVSEESEQEEIKEIEMGMSVSGNYNFIYISEAFVLARNFFQIGNTKDAVKMYIEILTHQNVSKQETHRALFELSQVYSSLGLHVRAFDTAMELLRRTPHNYEVLEHILKICSQGFFPDKLYAALSIYKGSHDHKLRIKIAHSLCHIGEMQLLENEKLEKAIELARNALRWERSSGRALMLLWQTTSQDLWQKVVHDPKMMWTALAADLEALVQIYKNTTVSPVAGAKYLSVIISKISDEREAIESYAIVKSEFTRVLNKDKIDLNTQKYLWASIFHASLLIQNSPELKKSRFLSDVLAILGESPSYFNFVAKQDEAARIGYSSHYCEKCSSFYSSFAWKCLNCNTEEALKPIIMPNFEHS